MPVFLRLWLGGNMGLDWRAGSLGLTIHYESNTTAAVRIVSRYFFNIFEWYHLKNAKESQSFYSGLTHPQAKCNSSMLWRKSISKLDGKRTPLNANNSVRVFSSYHYDNSWLHHDLCWNFFKAIKTSEKINFVLISKTLYIPYSYVETMYAFIMLILIQLNSHPVAVQCLSFFVTFTCI